MTFRTTFRLFLAAAALGALVWYLQTQRPPHPPGAENSHRILSFRPAQVETIRVDATNGLLAECSRRGDTWILTRPIQAPADTGNLTSLLNALEILSFDERITLPQRQRRNLTLANYGLEPPRMRILIKGPALNQTLLIGIPSPFGKTLFVKRADSDDVLATTAAILDIIPASLDAFRSRRLFLGAPEQTARLEIRRSDGTYIQLARVRDAWTLQQPVTGEADTENVRRLLDTLFSAKIRDFVWDPPAQTNRAEEAISQEPPLDVYILTPDQALERVHVWMRDDPAGQELLISRKTDPENNSHYARLAAYPSIFTVSTNLVRALAVSVDTLRSRRIFTLPFEKVHYLCFQEGDRKLTLKRKGKHWSLVEPVQGDADDEMVDRILRKLLALRAQTFVSTPDTNELARLDPPAIRIRILENEPPVIPATEPNAAASPTTTEPPPADHSEILVASLDTNRNPLATFSSRDLYFRLRGRDILDTGVYTFRPLRYRDRLMLSIPPEQIREILIQTPAGEQKAVLDKDGQWTARQPAGGRLNRDTLEALILMASRLRALRIQADKAPAGDSYGLDKPTWQITYGLTGEQGIRKTIQLGNPARPGEIYARIQGMDPVFVVPDILLATLRQNLVTPEKAAPATETPAKGSDEEPR